MSNHTPGPWEVHGDRRNLIGASDGKAMIATVVETHIVSEWCRSQEEVHANAKLIAAAPELKEALTHCLDALYNETHGQDEHGAESNWIKEVKAMSHKALEKARGTQVDGPYVGSLGVNKEMLDMLVKLQVALGEFCCDNCISYDDMEESHTELLNASNAADELIRKVKGL